MKGYVKKAVLAGVLLLFIQAGLISMAQASYDVSLDPAYYGTLDQRDVDPWNSSTISCGPTAVTNSFVFLQNRYPGVYGNMLVPTQGSDLNSDGQVNAYDDMIATARILYGTNYMKTDPQHGGTYGTDFYLGKQKYIEDRVPGVTYYKAQIGGWPSQIPKPSYIQENIYPTWKFLYDELSAAKDIEINLVWEGGGHFVTLRRFSWNDLDSDGVIDGWADKNGDGVHDNDEYEGYIKFIDPWTGANSSAWIWQDSSGHIQTGYKGNKSSWIYGAVSECPVPEPSIFILMCLGLIGLEGARKYKK